MKIEEKTAPALAGVEAGNLADWIGQPSFSFCFLLLLSFYHGQRRSAIRILPKNAKITQGGQNRE